MTWLNIIFLVIEKAQESGVIGSIMVAEYPSDFEKIMKLTERFPGFCYPCLGLHPVQGDYCGEAWSVSEGDLTEAIPIIEKHIDKLVAIGEVGLDFTPKYIKTDSDKDQQRKVLVKQIEIAKQYDLPINVHSRSAGKQTLEILIGNGVEKALLHNFSGKASTAIEGVKAGYYFSIPPSAVNSEQKRKLVYQVPLENLMLETDSPALGPPGCERNVPSNIHLSCEFIAQVKNIDPEHVAKITLENTLKLFPKIKDHIRY